VPASELAAGERTHVGLWLSAACHVVHYPVRGGAEVALVAVFPDIAGAGSAAWDMSLPVDRIRAVASRTTPPLQAVLGAAPSWRVWHLHRVAPVPMARGRIALLGDAAHPIRPHLAQGAVMALEDAVVLASSIGAAPGDPAAALARYAALRRPRVDRVAAASLRNGMIFHMQGVAAIARDTAMRMLGGESLMRRYDWLYGWRNA
jgi:salicylate hydroxylase